MVFASCSKENAEPKYDQAYYEKIEYIEKDSTLISSLVKITERYNDCSEGTFCWVDGVRMIFRYCAYDYTPYKSGFREKNTKYINDLLCIKYCKDNGLPYERIIEELKDENISEYDSEKGDYYCIYLASASVEYIEYPDRIIYIFSYETTYQSPGGRFTLREEFR